MHCRQQRERKIERGNREMGEGRHDLGKKIQTANGPRGRFPRETLLGGKGNTWNPGLLKKTEKRNWARKKRRKVTGMR